MFAKPKVAAVLAIAWVAATGASAEQGAQFVEEVGDWSLYYSQELGGSCFIERTDADGRQFQIGADRDKQQAWIGILAPAGSDVTEDMLRNVKFDLGGNMYEGEARRFQLPDADVQGGYVYFNNLNFARDLANQATLKVIPDGGDEFSLDLTGTKAAMEMALECQIATQ
ncbi:MAG: hypothetical protein AAGH83_02670 [Pseudomonadota bacterium]